MSEFLVGVDWVLEFEVAGVLGVLDITKLPNECSLKQSIVHFLSPSAKE